MTIVQAQSTVGKRVLLRVHGVLAGFDELHEFFVVEATDKNVKLRHPSGLEEWVPIKDTDALEEVLP